MTDPTRLVLTTLIAAAISHCEREIAEMNRAVRMLEKAELRRIEATYRCCPAGWCRFWLRWSPAVCR